MSDLQRFMKAMKITQQDLATKLGVSQAAISKVKIGQMDIPKNWVETIKKEYNYNITKYIDDDTTPDVVNEPQEEYKAQIKIQDQKYIDIIEKLVSSNQSLARSVELMADNINKITQIKVKQMEHDFA